MLSQVFVKITQNIICLGNVHKHENLHGFFFVKNNLLEMAPNRKLTENIVVMDRTERKNRTDKTDISDI